VEESGKELGAVQYETRTCRVCGAKFFATADRSSVQLVSCAELHFAGKGEGRTAPAHRGRLFRKRPLKATRLRSFSKWLRGPRRFIVEINGIPFDLFYDTDRNTGRIRSMPHEHALGFFGAIFLRSCKLAVCMRRCQAGRSAPAHR
jgi:hypothetical protein